MEETGGEPACDPALTDQFRLWQTALAEHGHVFPDGRLAVDQTPPVPGSAITPAPPIAVQADQLPTNERRDGQRRRWPAMIFVGALVLAILVAGYQDFNARQATGKRAAITPPVPAPQPDRNAPPDEADRRKAELADNIVHAGEVLATSGDPAAGLRLYRQSLSIYQELAARYPNDAKVQRALAGGWDKVADAFAMQGDTNRALGAYREAEAAWEHGARVLPGDREVQRNWSFAALSLGNFLLARNDPAGAVEAFRRGVLIQETLCRQAPDNAAWQEDLALGWLRLSDAFDQRGDAAASLQACRRALAIDEALVRRDSTNLAWQGDLATAHGKAGDLLLACNEVDAALQEYTAAASCREKLAVADANPERRRAVAEMKDRIGQALEVKKQPAAALPFYGQALNLIADLAKESPTDQSVESLRAAACFHQGRALAACQPADVPAARLALREARDKLTLLKSADGTYPDRTQAEMLADVERLLAQLDK